MTDIQVLYDGPIVKRADAIDLGLSEYFTGVKCKNNHIDQRRVNNRTCISCISYTNLRNKDRKKKWAEENQDKVHNSRKEYDIKNRENKLAYGRMWRLKNKERKAEDNRIWWSNNRDKARKYNHSRRAMLRDADGYHDEGDVSKILSDQRYKCAEPTCGVDLNEYGYHVDHIMPLKLGGSNWPENLQCLCPSCNQRKCAKHPLDWARENGRLV